MAAPELPPVLVAEDDANDLFLVRRHLARAGLTHPLLTFGNGEELIAYLETNWSEEQNGGRPRPVLLLLDIKMPRLGGFDVLRWLRARPSWRDLKTIVLSGSDEPKDIALARELGAKRFLTKYPPPSVFAELVRELG